MKKQLLYLGFIGLATTNAVAQGAVDDSVSMGAGYATNKWYSLANDEVGSAAYNNWDLGFAATASQTSELTTSIIFNHKIGSVYEIPNSSSANFASADTAGLSTWTQLYNSDSTWALGALKNTTDLGGYDYGWGSYDITSHNILANRVFVIKYSNGTYKKFYVNLLTIDQTYVISYADLDNTNQTVDSIAFSTYSTKNFIYYSLTSSAIVDREPASADWDFYFTQYPTSDYNPPYAVTGILQNEGVEVAKVYPVNDPSTYTDWEAATYESKISMIGWDWKSYSGGAYVAADSTVYFVKDISGDIWKVIMTGFVSGTSSSSSAGTSYFSKEKLTFLGVDEIQVNTVLAVYPNPASDFVNITVNAADGAKLQVIDAMGRVVKTIQVDGNQLQTLTIETTDLQAGVYNLVTSSISGYKTSKFVIQR